MRDELDPAWPEVALEGVHPLPVRLRRRTAVRREDQDERFAVGEARTTVASGRRCPAAPRTPGPGAPIGRVAGSGDASANRERHHAAAVPAKRSGNCATIPSWSASARTMISVKMSSKALTSAVQSPVIRATASSLVSLRWSARRSKTSCFGPVRVGSGQEASDLADVRGPARVVVRERGLVARLGGRDEVDRDHDVFLEQRRSARRRQPGRSSRRPPRRCPPGS